MNRGVSLNILRLSWWLTPIISFNWVRARDFLVLSKYQETLSKLALIKRLRGPNISPMGQWTTEYYVLQGHAYYSLGQKDKAMESFETAFREMDNPNDYSSEDKKYLSAFMISCHQDLDFGMEHTVEIEQIDLDDIVGDLKLYFPLKSHPDWDKIS